MTDEPMTIEPSIAAELYEFRKDGESFGEWLRLGDELERTSRWMECRWLVVSRNGHIFGVPYELGLTEIQENHLPWEDAPNEPITLVSLVGVQVTRTEYRQVSR